MLRVKILRMYSSGIDHLLDPQPDSSLDFIKTFGVGRRRLNPWLIDFVRNPHDGLHNDAGGSGLGSAEE